jgi:hypothetical protein
MDCGQKTPRGHLDFNSYVKNLRVLVFRMDGWTDGQTGRGINPEWASLSTFLQIIPHMWNCMRILQKGSVSIL